MAVPAEYLNDHRLRLQRHEWKTRATLRFLRDEYCASAEVIGLLLGVSAFQNVYSFLNRLTEKGYLRYAVYPVNGRNVRLWGLTPHGLAFSVDDGEPLPDTRPFQPSKMSAGQIPHKLDVQRLRLIMSARGATRWRYLHQVSARGQKEPDALADVGGRTVAFELERTVKSRKRYQEIVSGYLFTRKASGVDEIWYVSPDERTLARIRQAVLSVEEIVNPQTGEARATASLDRDRLFACFRFFTLDALQEQSICA